jgi:hypothetical protein
MARLPSRKILSQHQFHRRSTVGTIPNDAPPNAGTQLSYQFLEGIFLGVAARTLVAIEARRMPRVAEFM